MPRRRALAKIHEEPVYRNLVSHAFGLLMIQIRHEQALSLEEVASQLGFSASTGRLLESGAASLPPHCTLEAAEFLSFSFNRLATLVTIMHTLDHELQSPNRMRQQLDLFATVDPALRWLTDALAPLWRVSGESIVVVKRTLVARGIVSQLRCYLTAQCDPFEAMKGRLTKSERGRCIIEKMEKLPAPLAEAVALSLDCIGQAIRLCSLPTPTNPYPAVGT